MDWLDLLAVQGTLESSPTPQFKSINSSALSFLYSPTLTSIHDSGKAIALTRQTFVGKVTSLLFNMLSRLSMLSRLFNMLSRYLYKYKLIFLNLNLTSLVPMCLVILPLFLKIK